MNLKAFSKIFGFSFLFVSCGFCSLPIISKAPFVTQITPDSVLKKADLLVGGIRYAGNKPRYSTCSGVSWSQDSSHLITINMHACTLQHYFFDEHKGKLQLIKNFSNSDGFQLSRPENVDISSKGDFIVVPNMTSGDILFHSMYNTKRINPIAYMIIPSGKVHGVKLTPDDRFLVSASFIEGVNVYKIKNHSYQLVQSFGQPYFPLKAKTMDFSKDGRYVAIGYCVQLSDMAHSPEGIIAIYEFDSATGTINPNPVSYTKNQASVETLKFYVDGKSFFAVDQANSIVYGYEFDETSGQIGNSYPVLNEKESKLNIPHGIAFSPNGKYVAVTSYGDDKVTIYRIKE